MRPAHDYGFGLLQLCSALAVPILLAVFVWAAPGMSAQDAKLGSLRPYLWQPAMAPSELGEVNVFRRFSSDRSDAMRAFYTEVLGLEPLPSSALGSLQMIRYPVGASEVKLFPVAPSEAQTAAIGDVLGLRLLTLFFADEQTLVARFHEHGYDAPAFRARRDGSRAALVKDPDGEWLELVVPAKAAAAELERFEVGIVVSDLAQSRSFYRDFLGLDESGPQRDELLGVSRYSYRHASATINVWSVGAGRPGDTETAGLQYIVWDVERVNALAEAHASPIDRPLSEPGTLRTVWLTDPDGVSNYFAEYAGHDNRPPAERSH